MPRQLVQPVVKFGDQIRKDGVRYHLSIVRDMTAIRTVPDASIECCGQILGGVLGEERKRRGGFLGDSAAFLAVFCGIANI